jgi:hypothetical protein
MLKTCAVSPILYMIAELMLSEHLWVFQQEPTPWPAFKAHKGGEMSKRCTNHSEFNRNQSERGTTKMKRLVAGILGMLVVAAAASGAVAAESEAITLTVMIQNLSVSVSPTSKDFGTVLAGSADNLTSGAIDVTNDGNVAERVQLDITTAPTWTSVAGVPGAESYRLSCLFKSSQAVAGDFDKTTGVGDTEDDILVDGTAETCVGYNAGSPGDDNFATSDSEDGHDMAVSAVHHLYFNFDAPSTTAATAQQTMVVTITALAM